MAWKILGQIAPESSTMTPLYVVNPDKQATVSSIVVCNRSRFDSSFRLAIIPDSATLADQHYLYYDELIRANRTFPITLGITLQENAAIWFYSSNNQMTAQVFGVEIDEDEEIE